MALLMMEGFDHENANADLLLGIFNSAFPLRNPQDYQLSATGARFGAGKYAVCVNYSSETILYYGLNLPPANYATGIFGYAARLAGPSSSDGFYGMTFWDLTAFAAQVSITFAPATNLLNVYRGDSATGTLIGSVTLPANFQSLGWNYFESSCTISATAGTVTVRLNNITLLSLSGVNTKATANSFFNIVLNSQFFSASDVVNLHIDDAYFCDGTGAAPQNGFLGDVRVQTLFPAGTGNTAAWTPLSGSNWSNVSETAMDGDTTYNASGTVGAEDTFTHGSMVGVSNVIYGVQTTIAARKDDAGARAVASVVRSSSTEANGVAQVMTGSYVYYKDLFPNDPATAAPWIAAAVNASQVGYKVIS